MLRVISEIRPAYVVAENVRGAINLALDTVQAGMEAEDYTVRTLLLPAAAFGAPHKRERMFVIGIRKDVADTINDGLHHQKGNAPFQSGDRKDNGVSFGSDSGALWPTPSVHGNYNRAGVSDKSGNGLSTAVNLWPTPTSTERSGINPNTGSGAGLTHAVSLWPTPTVSDTYTGNLSSSQQKPGSMHSVTLPQAARLVDGHLWRTPDANCMRGLSSEERMEWKKEKGMPISIYDQVGKGSLNPAWVEILMGFPLGWTDVDCEEPEPWPGWPMRLWAGNWPTPQCFDATAGDLKGKEYTGKNRHALKLGNCINAQTGQYSYEPPRIVTGCRNRAKRLKCLGNAVVPQQARPIFEAIRQIHNLITTNVSRETLLNKIREATK
jgi:DNA (cytosine-5)-methyltransferase 1